MIALAAAETTTAKQAPKEPKFLISQAPSAGKYKVWDIKLIPADHERDKTPYDLQTVGAVQLVIDDSVPQAVRRGNHSMLKPGETIPEQLQLVHLQTQGLQSANAVKRELQGMNLQPARLSAGLVLLQEMVRLHVPDMKRLICLGSTARLSDDGERTYSHPYVEWSEGGRPHLCVQANSPGYRAAGTYYLATPITG